MTLRKRGSTLFPYTTLFRSGRSLGDTLIKIGKKIGPWMVRIKDRIATDIKEWNVERKEKRQEKSAVKAQQKELAAHEEDRKSTRLNSSHVSISYAVFCLKKK